MTVSLSRLVERSKAKIGGMKWFMKQNSWQERPYVGGTLTGGLKRGDMVFAGDFCYYDYTNRKCVHLKQFVLAKDLLATDTAVYFEKTGYLHTLRNDMNIMAEPETSASTGPAVSTASLVVDTADLGREVYKITITANALGTGTKGDVYVEAVEAGADVEPLVKEVNTILDENRFIDNDLADLQEDSWDSVAEITPYMHCTVYRAKVIVPKIAPESKVAVKEFYQL